MKSSSLFSCCALVALLQAGAVARAQSFIVTDLGLGTANDINSYGHVAGTTVTNTAFYYDGLSVQKAPLVVGVFPNPEDAGNPFTLYGDVTAANSLNDSEVVAVCGYNTTALDLGYVVNRYQGGTGGYDYPNPSVPTALGINSSGDLVGTKVDGGFFDFTVAVWDQGGNKLNYLMGYSRASAINDAGLVVGSAADQFPSTRGTIFQHPRPNYVRACIFQPDGTVSYIDPRDPGATAINELDPTVPNNPANRLSDAYGVNAGGHIVGDMSLTRGGLIKHAFRYADTNIGMVDLGTLGGLSSSAYDINSSDQVVGTSQVASKAAHAFVWTNGVMTDLNTLLPAGSGWTLQRATAINDRGEIVGSGLKDGVVHAFLLSPPEFPPTLAILVPPAGATVGLGQSYTLSVTAQGGDPLTYQWQHAGTNLPGATRSSFTITSATPEDAGSYLVTVQDPPGNAVSAEADLILHEIRLTAKSYRGLTLEGALGATYGIEYKASDAADTWTPLGTLTLAHATEFYVDYDSPGHPLRVYRAVFQP